MTVWVVSTTGTATGAGTIASPLDIDTAIGAASPVVAGDEIRLLGGTYIPLVAGETTLAYLDGRAAQAGKGCYTLKINGASGNQITIRNWPGQTVRINGGLHAVTGIASYITVRGIEIAPTPTTRVFANENAVDYPGLYVTAPGIKLYNNYLHDFSTVYAMEATGFDMDGCVVGWNGYYTSDVAYNRGYNLYAHNHGGGVVNIHRNAFLYSFSAASTQSFINVHFFGTGADVRDYDFRYNTVVFGLGYVGNATLINSGNKFNANYFMGERAGVQAIINVNNANASDIEVLDNYIWDNLGGYCIYNRGYKTISVQRNQVVGSGPGEDEWGDYYPNVAPVSVVRNSNTYYGDTGLNFNYNGTLYNMADWRTQTGFDLLSTITGGLPAANVVALTVCTNGKRGIVTVQNFLSSASVTVDLTTLGLTDGARCRYYNCLNMSEYVDFTYDAASPNLTISMLAASWSLRSPTAYDSPTAWPTEPFPSYGVFLVEQLDDAEMVTVPARDLTATVSARDLTATVPARDLTATVPAR